MGYRDDNLDDRADLALRRALERLNALEQAAPPPDLVTRAARRLPAAAPAIAARQLARQRALRLIRRAALASVLALIALLGLAGILGGGLARTFGDGAAGVSRTLLTVQLLAKPLWHSVGAGGSMLTLGGLVVIAGAAWLWWWMLRRTPIYYTENAP